MDECVGWVESAFLDFRLAGMTERFSTACQARDNGNLPFSGSFESLY